MKNEMKLVKIIKTIKDSHIYRSVIFANVLHRPPYQIHMCNIEYQIAR